MNETSAFSEYVSVERVPFVDRREVLQQIYDAMRAASPERPPVFFIKAPGGMGKTELLREILRRCRSGEWDGQRWAATNDVIDFYHLGTHAVEGLSSAIHDALQPGPSFFINFRSRLRDLKERRLHLGGLLQAVGTLRDLVGRALIEDLNAMARMRPAVLALDTAERLLYEPDEVQKALGMEDVGVAVLPWLLREFLPKIRNVSIILAGRPEPETPARLFEDLRQSVGDRLRVIELGAFGLEDALEYWEAASRAAEEERPDLAAWLRAIGPDRRRVIHRYTGGRPILLSLTLDYLLRADQLPDDLKEPEEVAVAKTGEELARVQDRLEERLVKEFQERGLPADPAIRLLGLARRGVDCELLGRLLGKPEAEARQVFETLRRLSFIKVRPADQRLFLHDEMYELLWKHVLQFDEIGRARAFVAILGYYKEKIAEANLALKKAPTDINLQAELYRLKAEEVHYRLRHEPWQGFQTYYYYSKEAYWINDDAAGMELRDELLEFNREFDRWAPSAAPLRREHITCDSALRWIDRADRQGHYEEAVNLVEKTRSTSELAAAFTQAGVLAQAELDALEGRAQIYLGRHLDKAGELLNKAREAVGQFQPEPGDDLSGWRKQALLAEIYNDLGYLARVRGQLEDSVAFYREAIVRWRQLGAPAEPLHANTLNNLSWALAERGRYQDALRFCLDGLELRQERGYRGPIAFSLNTLGLIEVRNDQPERAIHHCEQALSIFRDLDQPRGIGLACIALAEANRRSATSPAAPALDEQVKLLDRAVSLAGEAVAIFREQVPERERLVEALIELGCAYRDWMRIRGLEGYPNDQDPPPAALLSDGQKAFEEAIAQAQDAFAHRAADAQVNLAWLHFYAEELPRAEETANAVLARPEVQPYLIHEGKGLPDITRPQPFFWTQLGKLHLLLGRIAMKWHETADREEQIALIRDAAEHFTLALAYDYQFADDFRDLRRGKEAIYNALKGFNLQYEFPAFVLGMRQAAKKYRLPKPTRLQRFVVEAFGPLAQLGAGR